MNEFSLTAMRDEFERAAREWICEGYQVQLRYVARRNGDALNIVHAMVLFHAWLDGDKDVEQFNFHITAGDFEIGQKVMQSVSLSAAIRSLDEALNGEIRLPATEMSLAPGTGMLHHLRGPARDPWVNMIHMSVSALGAEQLIIPPTLDDQLRRADVPFDGYGDVLQWLSLNEFHHPAGVPSIAVVVHPPAMIAIGDGRLGNGKLTVVIEVMPAIDVETVTVAAMGSPPAGVSLRRQLRPLMQWTLDESRRRGVATIELPEAYMALVALSIGNSYVQRQWYSDPSLSKNVRFAATQEFDHDLAKIKDRLKTTDARAFEKAVAALLFLSGFAPLLPMGDDSPDVVGVTPGGQVVLIECTVKTTDAVGVS